MLKRSKRFAMCFFLAVLSCGLCIASDAAAGDFNMGVKGNIGFGVGSTDDSSVEGKIGFSSGGGLAVQYYFIEAGKMDFGLASGVEYLFLKYNSTDSEFTIPVPPFSVERASETSYNYLTIPLTIKVLYDLNEKLAVTGDVGGFIGIFLGGESDNTYTPDIGADGVDKLDDTNTESINAGLRFALGFQIPLSEKLKLVPGVLLDLGLMDITKDSVAPARDTLASWTFTVDLLYTIF
jgi:hypothetical protein